MILVGGLIFFNFDNKLEQVELQKQEESKGRQLPHLQNSFGMIQSMLEKKKLKEQ